MRGPRWLLAREYREGSIARGDLAAEGAEADVDAEQFMQCVVVPRAGLARVVALQKVGAVLEKVALRDEPLAEVAEERPCALAVVQFADEDELADVGQPIDTEVGFGAEPGV